MSTIKISAVGKWTPFKTALFEENFLLEKKHQVRFYILISLIYEHLFHKSADWGSGVFLKHATLFFHWVPNLVVRAKIANFVGPDASSIYCLITYMFFENGKYSG